METKCNINLTINNLILNLSHNESHICQCLANLGYLLSIKKKKRTNNICKFKINSTIVIDMEKFPNQPV